MYSRSAKNILITGLPGVGKTTLIKKLIERLRDEHPVGFCTSEIRERGERKGFELNGLDGRRGILAHVSGHSPFRVGKYQVDVSAFERFLDAVPFFDPTCTLVVLDEIGKMECFSPKFKKLLLDLLDSDKNVVATIARKGDAYIEAIKRRQDAVLYEITAGNRDALLEQILAVIQGLTS